LVGVSGLAVSFFNIKESNTEIISPERHATWSWRGYTTFDFARQKVSAPIVISEISHIGVCTPVLFKETQNGFWPESILTLRKNGGGVVRNDGSWLAPYIPASLRIYPFSCQIDDRGFTKICINASSSLVSICPEFSPLFDELGEPTVEYKKVIKFAVGYAHQQKLTKIATEAINRENLFCPARTFPSFNHPLFENYFVVDRARLNALTTTKVDALFRCRALELAQAHLTSLSATMHLRVLSNNYATAAGSVSSPADPVSGFLDAMSKEYKNRSIDSLELP
jgi:hypothetical protein